MATKSTAKTAAAEPEKKPARRRRTVKTDYSVEMVNVADLKPHPKNYHAHPEDQLTHLIESLEANGFYRNVVIAKDGTILAGHGIVQAAEKVALKQVPVIRLNVGPEDPKA